MRTILVRAIDWYQKYLSLDTGMFSYRKGVTCGFAPSCSEYTKQAILKYGSIKGIFLGVRRILRCHPWQTNHFDPLP